MSVSKVFGRIILTVSALTDAPILSPILAGRADEVRALQAWLRRVNAGSGTTYLVSGEAGIGKSRLVREAKTIAAELGLTVWQGNCFEQDRGLPFAPFVDLLRRVDVGLLKEDWQLAQMFKLTPDLAVRFPSVQRAPVAEPEQEKRELFRAWVSWLARAHAQTPDAPLGATLLIFEDLHWCDDVSLELLLQLARAVTTEPVALLLTYRNDQTTSSLDHLLAQLDRERLAPEIVLKPLNASGVEAMMRAIFQQPNPISREFVDAIYALTEGNPFFVEEVLKSLVASGDIYFRGGAWDRKKLSELQVPRMVQVAVVQRMERLSTEARRALVTAAVIGQRFEFVLLRMLTGASERDVLDYLHELIASQLVIEWSEDEYGFRHALTCEAAYGTLLRRERRSLHLAVGEAVEQLHQSDQRDAELSYHFYEASAWDKVLTYARRAGDRAQAMFAPREAITHFSRALEAAAHRPALTGEAAGGPVETLHRARGKAYEQVGEFDNALADLEAALASAQSSNDAQAEWSTLLDLGFLWASRDYRQAGELFRRALEIAPRLDDVRLAAHTLNRVGNWHMNAERPFEAIRYHHEALRLFESLDDTQGLASTLDLLGISHYVAGEYHRSVEFYARAVGLFRELNDKGGLLTALAIGSSRGIAWLGRTVLPTQSSLKVRVLECTEALNMALDMGVRPIETLAETWLGLNHAMSGEYAMALAHARRGLAIAEEIEHKHFMCTAHMVLGITHWDLAAWDGARAHLQVALALARETNSTVWEHFCAAFLTSALAQLNDLAAAEVTLSSAWNDETPMQDVGFRQLWAARAELWLVQGEPKRALELIERLVSSVPNFGMYRSDRIPHLVWLGGMALVELKRARDAVKALEAGLLAARECDLPALEWRQGVVLGKALLTEGKRDEAATAFAQARRVADALANRLSDERLRAGLIKASTVSMTRVALDSPRRKAKAQFEGLTGREREVAGHLAQGRSNRDIAEAMVVSERTVETHVTNILSKLGFSSRAQIAVWAAEKGLAK